MRRGVRSILGVAFAAVAIAATPAGAAPSGGAPPPEGTLTCALDGTGKFTPPLLTASNEDGALRRGRFTFKGTLTNCDNSGVTGGKMPITNGTVDFQAVLPEASGCNDLLFFGAPDFTSEEKTKLTISLKGTTASGKHPKVASLKTTVFDASGVSKGWELSSDSFPSERASAPFPDGDAIVDMILNTASLQQMGACAFGGPDLAGVTVSSADGATLTIE